MSFKKREGFWQWGAVILGGVLLALVLLSLAPAVEILPVLFITWSVAALYYLMPHAFRRRWWGWDFIPLMGSSGWLLQALEQARVESQDTELTAVTQKMKWAAAILAVMAIVITLTMPGLWSLLPIVLVVVLVQYLVRRFLPPRSRSSSLTSGLWFDNPRLVGTEPGTPGLWLENQRREQAEAKQREIEAQRQAVAQVAANVDRAVARAGNHLAATPFWLEDIGLLLYNDTQTPTISREEAVCAAGAHLRPYVILNCPYSMGGTKLAVSFSLWDDQDQLVYAAQVRQPLSDGATLLTPQTWVRIPDDKTMGQWSLRVSIKGYGLLAVHEFKWWRGDQELHFTSDGEIDPRIVELLMQRLAEPVEDESISLDELLAQQKSGT